MDVLVNLDVDDLEKAVRFYSAAFDLKVGRRFGSFAVELLGMSTPFYLLVQKAGTPAAAAGNARTYERHWTPVISMPPSTGQSRPVQSWRNRPPSIRTASSPSSPINRDGPYF